MAAPAGEKDVAIDMVGEQGHQIDPAVAARAVRKMDWFFMPAMTVGVSRHGPNPRARPVAPRLMGMRTRGSTDWSTMTR